MAQSLNEILKYGITNIKKFEWADCYRQARQLTMVKPNIEGAWKGAGLFPFNPQKVIRQIRTANKDQETRAIILTAAIPNKNTFSMYEQVQSCA